MTLYSIGHGTVPVDDLLDALRRVEVRALVDVRTAPGSRRHPQFAREALAASLEHAGIAYEWRPDLGGWRRPRPDSPHVALRNPSFRGYADHMDTPDFDAALEALVATGDREPTAFLCSETLWWRCHRRMIADALLVRGIEVMHVVRDRTERHRLHPAARAVGGRLRYDVGEDGTPALTLEEPTRA